MEVVFCPDFEPASASPDLGYCSSFSPTSSIDSSCFSPPVFQVPGGISQPKEPKWISQAWEKPSLAPIRRSRSKNPGKKRQSASEREKLRMRDLTKALHNLRSFLPPSVAPAGQTLTKIETLRLTIHYISYLSSQVGLDENFSHAGDIQSHSATPPVQQDVFSDVWSQTTAQQSPPSWDTTQSNQQTDMSSFSTEDHRDTQLPSFCHCSHNYTHCDLTSLL